MEKITWRDVVLAAMEALGGKASLEQLYKEIEGHKRQKQTTTGKKNKTSSKDIQGI